MFDSRKDSEKYHLLRREDGSIDNDDLPSGEDHGQDKFPDDDGLVIRPRAKTPLKLYYCIILLATLNLIVVSLCFGVLVKWNRLAAMGKGASPQQLAGQDVTPYAKLGREPSAPWPYDSGYGPEITNHSLLDERWEALSIDDGIVAIDHAWAAQMNLGPSQNFPWDESKGLYVITAYHTVHCLMTLHRLVYELHHDLPRTRDTGHALHCLAHMRTDAMCEADDFLLPTDRTQYMRSGPRGQPRVCRSWDQLADWARQNHACYQHISDDEDRFAVERDEIERYFACPEDSPYYARMQQYKTEKGY